MKFLITMLLLTSACDECTVREHTEPRIEVHGFERQHVRVDINVPVSADAIIVRVPMFIPMPLVPHLAEKP